MRSKCNNFFIGVVVEYPTTHWDFCDFKCFDPCFMVVDVDGTLVETRQKPGFCGMEINALDAI
jgi:hypothetical protein